MKKAFLILTAFAVVSFSASAQGSLKNAPGKTIIGKECSYKSHPNSPEMVNVLNKIQKESENTVIYPLVRIGQMVRLKVQALKHESKHRKHIKTGSVNYKNI